MYNRILTNKDRTKYKTLIDKMKEAIPEMMARKISEANVQQAFMIDMIIKKAKKRDSILCVGSYEDTAYEYLKKLGYNIIGICPEVDNMTLEKFMETNTNKFNIVFSTSVIEHVEKDEVFIEEICSLLEDNGLAILTMDFNNSWKSGKPKPSVDYRLYTKADYGRLSKVAEKNNCFLLDEFIADAEPDFTYEGTKYSFSTMVFKKLA